MGLKVLAFVLAVIIGVSHSLPAGYEADDVEYVNPVRTRELGFGHRQHDFDTLSGFGGFDTFSFPGFGFGRIADWINAMQERIAAAFAGATLDQDLLSKGNKTSETKIIQGNCVTLNQTEYNKDGVHIIVKNVEVVPLSECDGTSTGSTPVIQEIPSTTNAAAENIETFGDKDNEVRDAPEKLTAE